MRAKYKIQLTDQIYGHMSISIDIPPAMKEKCEILAISEAEQQNLIGQRMQEIIYLLGMEEV